MDRLHGYSLDETYPYRGVYSSTFPARLQLLSLMAGHRPPDPQGPLTLLEFGCGQGMNLCIQAALHPQGRFIGLDLSADHIAHAAELAQAAGLTNVHFLQADILDLIDRQTLPPALEAVWGDCQIVLAHGVFGWVSPGVGRALLAAARAALAPGGLFFLSYNTLPGWLSQLPFQHAALALGRRRTGAPAGIAAARRLFDQLADADALLFRHQPRLATQLARQAERSSSYLLHEYGHEGWQPLYADQVIEACASEGLSFLGSADLPACFPDLLPEAHQTLIRQQPDVALQQLVRDLLVNESFRRDVYVRGRVPLWEGEAERALGRICLRGNLRPMELEGAEPLRFPRDSGLVELPQANLQPLLRRLQRGPVTLADLLAEQPLVPLKELLVLVALLLDSQKASLISPPSDPAPARRLNALLLERIAAGAPYEELATPACGNVVAIDRRGLLALQALAHCRRADPLDPAVVEILSRWLDRAGLRFHEVGETPGEQRAALLEWLARFQSTGLPRLRALGVVGPDPEG